MPVSTESFHHNPSTVSDTPFSLGSLSLITTGKSSEKLVLKAYFCWVVGWGLGLKLAKAVPFIYCHIFRHKFPLSSRVLFPSKSLPLLSSTSCGPRLVEHFLERRHRVGCIGVVDESPVSPSKIFSHELWITLALNN
jgi:hypothetical protein